MNLLKISKIIIMVFHRIAFYVTMNEIKSEILSNQMIGFPIFTYQRIKSKEKFEIGFIQISKGQRYYVKTRKTLR